MPGQYNGLPAVTTVNLPSAKNISTTSNTSPIVVTTSTAHSITTGDAVFVAGATDTAANGLWLAGTTTSNTVQLLVFPTGAASTPGGGGGAAGTIFDAGFGPTYAIPSGADKPNASSVNVAFEALGDRTAFLLMAMQYDLLNRIGGRFRALGRKVLIRPRVALGGTTNHTIDVTQADRYTMADPTAPRTITVAETGSPLEGETQTVVAPVISGGGTQLTIQRADTTVICTFVGGTVASANPCYAAEIERVGGVWRLGMNSGLVYDGGAPDVFGVVPGAGA